MKKYECPCGYVYDPAIGDPDNGIAPGTAWEDVSEDWVCPICGMGKEVFYEDAANALIPSAYAKAVDECEEEIVSSPKIEVVQLEAGKPFIFTAEVALKPEVTLGKYKGVKIDKIDVVPQSWGTVTEAFEDAYKHERHVSQLIDLLVKIAAEEKDNATQDFLWGFVREQVEEEATVLAIVEKLRKAGEAGILVMDAQLHTR